MALSAPFSGLITRSHTLFGHTPFKAPFGHSGVIDCKAFCHLGLRLIIHSLRDTAFPASGWPYHPERLELGLSPHTKFGKWDNSVFCPRLWLFALASSLELLTPFEL
jgi:hypothetical protein